MHFLYSALFTLLLPFILLRMLWRSRNAPAYRQRLGERLGLFRLPVDGRDTVWIHAVSLGETLAARPLIERLLEDYPRYRLLVTTTTPTGSEQVRRLFGDRVAHVYAPWDTPGSVKRFMREAQPRLLILMETELWPNMLKQAALRGCNVLLFNARLSARSAAGYARFPNTTRRMLRCIDWIAAQSTADADHFLQLGMDPGHMAVSGSIKFDVELSSALRDEALGLRKQWSLGARDVVIFSSTHLGEDELALVMLRRLKERRPDLLLILVPRHPERFETVHRLLLTDGWQVARRSSKDAVEYDTDILLVDTLGELLMLCGVADIAVIGGSFLEHGGHNPLEAAVWGRPILCGPSMFNFADVTERLVAADALEQVEDAQQLASSIHRLLDEPATYKKRAKAAEGVVLRNRGALDNAFAAVRRLLGDA
ncbi:MAG: lipid IV(A) 3-deoxy-D-manno-octulosonic acid transferase [Congregibacter sp.]